MRQRSSDKADPNLGYKLTTPESLSRILEILIHESVMYYKYGLGEESVVMADSCKISTIILFDCILL